MHSGKIAISIADDHAILRQGLRRIVEAEPDMKVVSEASTGGDAFKQAQEYSPDVVILDVAMPDQNGIETMRQILRIPDTVIRVLILSVHLEYGFIAAAMGAGASGYLSKDALEIELVSAIRAIVRGSTVFSTSVARVLLDTPTQEKPPAGALALLSDRERQVFLLLAEGKTPTEAAATLFISPKTIHTHRQHINEKLKVRTTTELIRLAIREGLIQN